MHETMAFRTGRGPLSDPTTHQFYDHSSAQRVNTDAVLVESLRRQYPNLLLTVVESSPCDLLSYAAATGLAVVTPLDVSNDPLSMPLTWTSYIPPPRRIDGAEGRVISKLKYGKFLYSWKSTEFLLYIVDGRDGTAPYPQISQQYLLGPPNSNVDELVRDSGLWALTLHDEIWVFDNGFWIKDAALYHSVQKSSWDDVILDEGLKQMIQRDVNRFFDSRERYNRLRVPWKRGAIYYGPPGNGKTISIKATMHTLYKRNEPVPSLYVRSLSSFAGPEYSIKRIFELARQEAPCLLIFEDLDSLIGDQVRSYLYNEMDGLQANDGVLIIGSTNHLDRLDPGMSKRPSRFDRKFEFAKPNMDQRAAYANYWRHKLDDNEDIEFPRILCQAIAGITKDFSFAYLQEAFVATLLAIAAKDEATADEATYVQNEDLDRYLFWREMKHQVKTLREEM